MLFEFVSHYDLSLSVKAKGQPVSSSREEAVAYDDTYILKLGVLPLKLGEAGRRDIFIGVVVKGTRCKWKQVSARWPMEDLEWSLARVLLVAPC